MKNILVTGGCGYVGSRLVPYLLSKGYKVSVLDSLIFGNNLTDFNFRLIKGDIRDKEKLNIATKNIDTIIHLAAISNDPTAELNPEITKEVNYDAVINLAEIAKKNNVKRLILASSSTLYGYQGEDIVLKEGDKLNPLTLYGKYKAESEEAAFKFADDNFVVTALRPGTVAGFSLRQRFDLIVNIFTNNAVVNHKLRIDGGKQKRPIINITDICRAYECMILAESSKIQKESFNVVGDNMTIEQIAKKVCEVIPNTTSYYVEVNDDRRSYFTSGDKIKNVLGFVPRFTVEDSIRELEVKLKEGFFDNSIDNEKYFNIKFLKKLEG